MAAVGVLIDYLRQLQRRGETHVRLDEEAREILRACFRAAHSRKGRTPPAPPTPEPATEAVLQLEGESPAEQLAALRAQAAHWEPARSLGSLRETMVFAVGDPQADLMLVGEAPGYEEERRQEHMLYLHSRTGTRCRTPGRAPAYRRVLTALTQQQACPARR